jgi:uncharacterized RDD family membrane protein YckC
MANPYAPPRAAVTDVVNVVGIVPADRGTRLGAVLLDSLIAAAMISGPLVFALFMTGALTTTASGRAAGTMIALALVPALAGAIVWCWLTVKYVKENGQTIAKKILGIKVIRSDGSAASLGRIFWLRNAVNSLITVIPLFGTLYSIVEVLFIFGDSRQCLHDKIADTIVVKA